MLLELLRDLVWGLPTVGLILGFGLYFTVQSRCIQLRGLKTLARETLRGKHASEKGCISPLRALSTALGGTVGIGSIVGVGLGISLGGAGSIFWMWVCGLLTAAVKYAEVYIAVARRRREGDGFVGGTMYCLDDAGRHGMAIFFSLCCILAAFGVGNLVQSNAIADVLAGVGAKPLFSAALLALLLALVIFDGRSRIAAVNAFLVPLFSALYILAMLFIILQNASAFPDALRRIFSEAFGLRAAAGGFSASLLSAALRVGVSKGIFSSEAGMGSSPIAHAAAEGTTPYRQGGNRHRHLCRQHADGVRAAALGRDGDGGGVPKRLRAGGKLHPAGVSGGIRLRLDSGVGVLRGRLHRVSVRRTKKGRFAGLPPAVGAFRVRRRVPVGRSRLGGGRHLQRADDFPESLYALYI